MHTESPRPARPVIPAPALASLAARRLSPVPIVAPRAMHEHLSTAPCPACGMPPLPTRAATPAPAARPDLARIEREYVARAHHGRPCLDTTWCCASGGIGNGCRNTWHD